MFVKFKNDFKPTNNQEIIKVHYKNGDDFRETIKLLNRLPVRFTYNIVERWRGDIEVIVPKKNSNQG